MIARPVRGYEACVEPVAASTPERIRNPWGERTPYPRDGEWPTRVDTHLADGVEPGDVDDWFISASILHSNGDEIDIAVKDGRIVGVRGDEHSRVNHGRLGPKDLFGWQANHSPDRLTRPLVREDGELRETDFYTSGQLFLEDYYTLAVVARAGLGTNHLDGTRASAPRPPGRRSRSRSAATASPARTRTSTTRTRSAATATTSPRRRPCCGCECSTGCMDRTVRGCSSWIRGGRRWRRRRTFTSPSVTAPTSR